MNKFASFALKKKMIDALTKLNYLSPTKIQESVIPKILRGENVVARSATGSGKTHAFLIPLIERIDFEINVPQVLIISPTRELAKQTYDFASQFVKFYADLNIKLVCGGQEKSREVDSLRKTKYQIIIGTPGRISDLVFNEGVIKLDKISSFVLDEADMLMDMGFFQDVDKIINQNKKAQLLVFSATMQKGLKHLLNKYIKADSVVDYDSNTQTNSNVKHYLIDTRHQDLYACIDSFIQFERPFSLIIFANKISEVKGIYKHLVENKYKVGIIHGDLESRERKTIMRRIKSNEFDILVCSDIASRGLDIPNVSHVLNVDFPSELSFYFHRAGRTGRYDKEGKCFTFYDNDHTNEIKKLLQIKKVNFVYLSLKNGELIQGKPLVNKKRFVDKKNEQLELEIKKNVAKVRSNKVKPGYKRKIRLAVEKTKRKHRREMIKKDIRRQREERYKNEARSKK